MTEAEPELGPARIRRIKQLLMRHIPEEWGKWVDVPDTWLDRLWELNRDLEAIDPNYEVHQIKEKFGGLRFYLSDASSNQMNELVDQAELDIEKLEKK